MPEVSQPSEPAGDPGGYALAYNEGVRALEHQERSVDELRSRAGTLLAASSLTTSFLAAAALPKGVPWDWPVWVALGAFTAGMILGLVVLWPRTRWVFVNEPGKVVGDYVEDDPPASLAAIHRDLALHAQTNSEANDKKLQRLYWAFGGAALSLFVQVVAWLIVLWGGTRP